MPHALDRINTGQRTVTATATLIVDKRVNREGVELTKLGTQDLYVASCGNVTTSTGHLFAGACGTSRIYPTTDQIYGVVAAGGIVVTYLEIYP